MIRSELIKYLSEKVGVTHEVAELALNTIFNSMTESAGSGVLKCGTTPEEREETRNQVKSFL